MITLLVS